MESSGLGARCCLWAALQRSDPNTQTSPQCNDEQVLRMQFPHWEAALRRSQTDATLNRAGRVSTIERTLGFLAVEVASIALEMSKEMATNRSQCCSNCRSALVGGCENANMHKER